MIQCWKLLLPGCVRSTKFHFIKRSLNIKAITNLATAMRPANAIAAGESPRSGAIVCRYSIAAAIGKGAGLLAGIAVSAGDFFPAAVLCEKSVTSKLTTKKFCEIAVRLLSPSYYLELKRNFPLGQRARIVAAGFLSIGFFKHRVGEVECRISRLRYRSRLH